MRHGKFTRCRLVIGVALMAALATAAMPRAVVAQLDHFQCYETFRDGPFTPPGPVMLEDQFDSSLGIVEEVKIGDAIRFCNPAAKRFPATSRPSSFALENHLTFYPFEQLKPIEITGSVKVVNQFGDQSFRIQSANVIAVPTQKLEPLAHAAPTNLDHFKCYFAQGASKAFLANLVVVGLRDQFATVETRQQVVQPLYFCNPVEKEVAGLVTAILNPSEHLTCYRISPGTSPVVPTTGLPVPDVFIANQFGELSWKIGISDLLCVPTEKVSFKISIVP